MLPRTFGVLVTLEKSVSPQKLLAVITKKCSFGMTVIGNVTVENDRTFEAGADASNGHDDTGSEMLVVE